jgi:hypothetical protein
MSVINCKYKKLLTLKINFIKIILLTFLAHKLLNRFGDLLI